MNRVICHLCPILNSKDLEATGIAMAVATREYDNKTIYCLRPNILTLSQIYNEIIDVKKHIQPCEDFFGARDFYSVIREFLNSNTKFALGSEFMLSFLRNFSGVPIDRHESGAYVSLLFKHTGMKKSQIVHWMKQYNPAQLVERNLREKMSNKTARHIMVITRFPLSWNVLLDLDIITYDDEFIFGSEFARD
eukprot:491895_1